MLTDPAQLAIALGMELLIIAERIILLDIQALLKPQPRIDFQRNALRQPNFIVHASLLDEDPRAFMQPGQDQPKRHRIDALDIGPLPLQLVPVNPSSESELSQKSGFFQMAPKARPWLSGDLVRISFASPRDCTLRQRLQPA